MADPISMLMIGSAVASSASSIIGGMGASAGASASARAMRLEAKMAQALAEREAKETTDQGFFLAQQRREEVKDALHTLTARAASSGASATNPTVFSLIRQITERGEEGAQSEIRAARQKAYQIRAQSILNSNVAGMKASAVKAEGKAAALGSYISGAGNALSAFAKVPSFGGTGYARFR